MPDINQNGRLLFSFQRPTTVPPRVNRPKSVSRRWRKLLGELDAQWFQDSEYFADMPRMNMLMAELAVVRSKLEVAA